MKQQDTVELPILERPVRSAASGVQRATPVPATSPASGPARVEDATQPPLVSAKLMQNYRLEAPVSAAGEVQAVLDGAGNLAVFTTGTNNRIYANRFTPGSDTGWIQTDTGLQSSQFAAGLDANGRLVVAIPSVTNVAFVEENADGTWGGQQTFNIAPQSLIVSAVRLKRLRNTLWVMADRQNVCRAVLALRWNVERRADRGDAGTVSVHLGCGPGLGLFAWRRRAVPRDAEQSALLRSCRRHAAGRPDPRAAGVANLEARPGGGRQRREPDSARSWPTPTSTSNRTSGTPSRRPGSASTPAGRNRSRTRPAPP